MRAVLLIVGKDLRRLWVLATLGFAFSFLSTLGWFWDLYPRSSGLLVFVFSQIAPIVVLFFLSVGVVQLDPAVGDKAFWRTRPIPPGALLCAKLLTLLLVFGVPSLLVNAYLALSMDAPRQVALGMLIESTGMILVESLLFALLGALTRSLLQAGAVLLFAVLAVAGASALVPIPTLFAPWRMDIPDQAPRMAALGLYGGLAAVGLLVHQYATRRLWRSVALALVVAPVVLFFATRWPVSMRAEAGEPVQPSSATAPSSVQVMLLPPAVTWSWGYANDPSSGKVVRSHTVAIGAAIRSVPAGRIVQVSSVSSLLRFADGQELPLQRIGREFWPNWSSQAQAAAVCRQLDLPVPAAPGPQEKQPTLRLFSVTDKTAGAFSGRKGTLTATLKLYELEFRDMARLPAARGARWTRDGQMWRIQGIALGEGKVVATLQHLRATSVLVTDGPARPDGRSDRYRYALALVNRARGEFALGHQAWDSSDAPQWTIDINTRSADFSEFWKIGGAQIPAPADPAWLDGAELVILAAEPMGSFDKEVVLRDFEIPQVADHPDTDMPTYWQ